MAVYRNNNGQLDIIAGFQQLSVYAPVGSIIAYGGNTPPIGWLQCNGALVSRTRYADLFSIIGTTYGEGDGSTTFALPDLSECVPVGIGQSSRQLLEEEGHSHDVYTLGEFKDDQIQNITGTTFHSYRNAIGGAVTDTGAFHIDTSQAAGQTSSDTPTINCYGVSFDASRVARAGTNTHGKQLGVNYIIKANALADITDVAIGLKQEPDWEHAQSITAQQLSDGHTAPADGVLVGVIAPNGYGFNEEPTITINDVIATMGRSTSNEVVQGSIQCQVNANDTIKITNCTLSRVGTNIHFVPFKTVAVKLSSSTPTESISLEDSYSTTEIKTNKIWIDGKPIYRKVFNVQVVQNGNNVINIPDASFAWFDYVHSFMIGTYGYRQPWTQVVPYWTGTGITLPSTHPTGDMTAVIEYIK